MRSTFTVELRPRIRTPTHTHAIPTSTHIAIQGTTRIIMEATIHTSALAGVIHIAGTIMAIEAAATRIAAPTDIEAVMFVAVEQAATDTEVEAAMPAVDVVSVAADLPAVAVASAMAVAAALPTAAAVMAAGTVNSFFGRDPESLHLAIKVASFEP